MIDYKTKAPFQNFADAYIKRGWFIFPLRVNDKKPITTNGFKDASNDPTVVQEWARKYPYANIGIATEASNLIVVDCDSSKGETPPSPWNQPGIVDGVDVFATAIGDTGNQFDFNTLTVCTPNNGWHYYFQDQGIPIQSGANVNGMWRVDVRSKGGYIVAPGSRLDTGEYVAGSIGSVDSFPQWMRTLLGPKKSTTFTTIKTTVTRYSKSNNYFEMGIRKEIHFLSLAAVGTRNQTLNKTAFACGRLVGSCPELRDLAINALKRTAISIGLSEAEAAKTISSAFKAGLGASRG